MEQHYLNDSILVESLDQSLLDKIKVLNNFSSKQLEVGKKFIPVPMFLVGSKLIVQDIQGHSPATTPPAFCTLLGSSHDGLTFLVNNQKVTYPNNKLTNLSFATVLAIANAADYDKLRTMLALSFEQVIPALSDDKSEGIGDRGNGGEDFNVNIMRDPEMEEDADPWGALGKRASAKGGHTAGELSADQKSIANKLSSRDLSFDTTPNDKIPMVRNRDGRLVPDPFAANAAARKAGVVHREGMFDIFKKKAPSSPDVKSRITPDERDLISKYFPSNNSDMKSMDDYLFPSHVHAGYKAGKLTFMKPNDQLRVSVDWHHSPADRVNTKAAPVANTSHNINSEADLAKIKDMLDGKKESATESEDNAVLRDIRKLSGLKK